MAHYSAVHLGDQRDGERAGGAEREHNEVLGAVALLDFLEGLGYSSAGKTNLSNFFEGRLSFRV